MWMMQIKTGCIVPVQVLSKYIVVPQSAKGTIRLKKKFANFNKVYTVNVGL